MDVHQAQQILNGNGFPCGDVDGRLGPRTAEALRRFQEAYNNGPWLTPGAGLDAATAAGLVELPHLSPHFTVAELRSRGNGDCYVRRELLTALEQLRARIGRPLPIRDAYRDPAHNRAVGGAQDSMHMFGLAADLFGETGLTVAQVQGYRLFAGIGDKGGVVLHVDCRDHAGANNRTPGVSPAAPARWHY